MLNIKKFSKESISLLWGLSYVLIMLICLVFVAVVFVISSNMVKEQADSFNKHVFDNTRVNTSNILNSMHRISYDISSKPILQEMINVEHFNLYFKSSTITQFQRQLSQYSKFTNDIDFFYIYIIDTDTLICERGIFDSLTFYNAYLDNEASSYDDWKKNLSKKDNDFYTMRFNNEKRRYNAVVFNMAVTPNPPTGKKGAVISVVADEEKFFGSDYGAQWTNLSDIFIFNNEGNIILKKVTSGKEPPQNVSELKYIGNDRIVLSGGINFDTVKMYIAISSPKKVITANIVLLRVLFFICLFIWIIISIVVIFGLVKANYKPIEEMMSILGVEEKGNEFIQIKKHIENMIGKNQTLEKIYEKQLETLRCDELAKLLTGRFLYSYTYKMLENYNIVFDKKKFAVFILHIQSPDKLFNEYADMTEENRYLYMRFIIFNVFEELLNTDNMSAYVTEADNMFVCIVNYNEDNLDVIKSKADYGINFINRNFKVDVSYALSGVHESVEKLSRAYREALSVEEYKMIFENGENLTYYDINAGIDNLNYCFNDETEQKLISCVKKGDYDSAAEYIISIFTQVKSEKNLTPEYLRLLIFDIAASMLKITDVLGMDRNDIISTFGFNENKFGSENLDQVQNSMLEYINNICQYIKDTRDDSNSKLVEQVKKYIQMNYADHNLCVASIGEVFHITSSYLSKKFRIVSGEPLANYISKYRIKKAKELMSTTNHNHNAIAAMVGFGHSRTFYRVFKKYEGITPTEYKENLRKFNYLS